MKKVFSILMGMVLLLSLATNVFAWDANDWPDAEVPADSKPLAGPVIATVTYTFINGKNASSPLYEIRGETSDQTIETYLKHLWDDAFDVKQITHIDGISIEQTKWKNYAGVIRTKNPLLDDNPATTPKAEGENIKVGETIYKPFAVTVKVDGDAVTFPDAQPYIATPENRSMVPMRAVYQHQNVQSTVIWDGTQKTVTASNNLGQKVVFTIGKKEYLLFAADGSVKTLYNDVAPVILKDRTYLPLRALGEAFGIDVGWEQEQLLVDMKTSGDYKKYLLPKAEWQKKLSEAGQQ